MPVRVHGVEVMFKARDPYSRKLFIDRGETHGVALGAPVVHADGVLGQVTRLFPLAAEVSLLTDRDATIPVLLRRSMVRGIAFGGARSDDGDAMELRFVSANADVEAGDLLETSGIDGMYPPGLAVARVATVERRVDACCARVPPPPAANATGLPRGLALEPMALQRPPSPEDAASAPAPGEKGKAVRR